MGIGGGVDNPPDREGLPNSSRRFISLVNGTLEGRDLENPDVDDELGGDGEIKEFPETNRLSDMELVELPMGS